jgi:ribonuclease HI
VSLPPSLTVAFDASVLYAADNATPVSGAIGFVIREGREPVVERSASVETFVGNVALEYRALRAASAVVADQFDQVASVHVRGDADVVIETVDPERPATPSASVVRRRVAAIRENLADVPTVSYRAVDGDRNRRAHRLARGGHSE